jgi:hypothetical protein
MAYSGRLAVRNWKPAYVHNEDSHSQMNARPRMRAGVPRLGPWLLRRRWASTALPPKRHAAYLSG